MGRAERMASVSDMVFLDEAVGIGIVIEMGDFSFVN
jgi:phosphotransferase system IIA component